MYWIYKQADICLDSAWIILIYFVCKFLLGANSKQLQVLSALSTQGTISQKYLLIYTFC